MYHLIVNPTAGNGKASRMIDDVEAAMNKRKLDYQIHITKHPEHATSIARELVENGAKTIVAVGGDGTIAEIGMALIDTDTALGIIPAGTGNDYRMSFDIPDAVDDAVEYMLQGKALPYDAFEVNGKRYLNIASMGFDADVVRRGGHYKIFGSAAYTLGAIEAAFFAKSHPATITMDGETIEVDMLMTAVGCGTHYGGGMNPLPHAKKHDGLLDICVVEKAGTFGILNMLPQFVKGEHEALDIVTMYTAEEITIKLNDTKLIINADGEVYEPTDIFHAKVIPSAINIIRL